MKNIKYYLILLLTLGCENKLEQVNPSKLSPGSYYKTEAQAVAAVDAVYNALVIDGAYNRMTPAMSDGRSDEVICRSPWNVMTGVSTFNLSATFGENAFAWNAYYQLIYRANQVLEYVPAIEMNADLKNRILGQAYFLRGLAYFNLTLLYDIVPLITTIPKGNTEFYAATATKDAIWQQIKADFTTAKGLLPVSYNDVDAAALDNGQTGRATKGAATALLGKVLLYNKDYQGAATEFEAVFALNKYKLATNYKDNFTDVEGVERSNPETLFSVEFTTSDSPGFNWGGDPDATWRQFIAVSPTYGADKFGFYDFIPSPWLNTEMRLEQTKNGTVDPRLLATILSYEPEVGYKTAYGKEWFSIGYKKEDIFIKKYTNADLGKNDEFGFNSGINYNVIRLADVYLMYAECKNELDDRATCAEYIQKVRDRANLPDRKVEFTLLSQTQMRDQISHERVMELSIESTRIYDIIRWGWLKNPTKLAELQAHDPEFKSYQPGKEYLKIPQGELDLNPNLKPNSAN